MARSFFASTSALVAGFALLTPVGAETFVVDDDGGPGVDFTDIPPAVAVANPGDLILVERGSYSGFLLDKGLTVLGRGDVLVSLAGITIEGTATPVVVSNLFVEGMVHVYDCTSVVVLESLDLGSGDFSVTGCRDVRIHRSTNIAGTNDEAVSVLRSRLEVVQSALQATGGRECYGPGPGTCLRARVSAVRFALSSAIGLRGDDFLACWEDIGGDGGHGLAVLDSTDLVIAGIPGDEIRGGDGGFDYGAPGIPVALRTGSTLRFSGVTLTPGMPGCPYGCPLGPALQADGDCTAARAVPADPTLALLDDPVAGQTVRFRLHAPAFSSATLFLGRQAIVASVPGVVGEQLTSRDRSIDLGTVPASGVLTWDLAVPLGLPEGLTLFAQASVVYPGLGERLTNSQSLVLR